jgi:hypothetical protein
MSDASEVCKAARAGAAPDADRGPYPHPKGLQCHPYVTLAAQRRSAHGVVYTKRRRGRLCRARRLQRGRRARGLAGLEPEAAAPQGRHAAHTTQIGPTILKSLGIAPTEIKAVREEKTRTLPGF